MLTTVVNLSYLMGATAFVIGLRQMSSPDTAQKGNFLATIGMGIAIVATILIPLSGASNNYLWIFGAMTLGGIIGYVSAKKIEMTAMPQMVSVFNGLGGACAVVLAITELIHFSEGMNHPTGCFTCGKLLCFYYPRRTKSYIDISCAGYGTGIRVLLCCSYWWGRYARCYFSS
jgi:NAD/NADP transhydrogenase beta subunit